MNTDAAEILLYLQQEKVGRKPDTIARKTSIPRNRVDGALLLLKAIDKVTKDSNGSYAVGSLD